MKRNLVFGGCAALLCAASIASAADRPTPAPVLEGIRHGPINPHRHADGSLKRGVRNEISTGNWSGFAVANYQTGKIYSFASATWQIPSITYAPYSGATGGTTDWELSSIWVGIGGYCQNSNCSSVDQTLIQLGIGDQVANSLGAFYYAWYELLPGGPVAIPYHVKPGDIVTASLQCAASCSPNTTQTWVLAMSDQTAGWQWSETFQYQSVMDSAEWIVEAPYSGGVAPLADYTQANFEPVSANGANPNLTLAANGIAMEDPSGQTSNPSSPLEGNWFGTCWGNGTTLTTCTTAAIVSAPPPPPPPSPPSPSPAPTASLTPNPGTVSLGQVSTLSWSSTHASSCTGGGFTTSGATSGSTTVFPFGTTNYSLTCNGTAGSATAEATVHVKGFFSLN